MILEMLWFFATAFAGTVLTAGVAFVIGRAAAQLVGLQFDSFEEEAACSVAAGFVIIALLIFLLGIGGLLVFRVLVPVIVLLLAASIPLFLRGNQRSERVRKASRSYLFLGLCVFLILSPLFLLPLYPPTESDAIRYHLAVAKQYLQTGAVQPTPQYRYAVFPQLVEMLFAGALMMGGDRLAQCVSLVFLLITALAVAAFVRWTGHGRSSIWASALLLSNSAVLMLGGAAYTDMALTALVTLAVLSFERWHESGNKAWLLFSGAMAGSAAGTKYSALFFPLILGVLALASSIRQRSWRPFFTLTISCIVTALPWYLYNAFHTGNPVWPFLSQYFGHAFWNEADIQGQTADLLTSYGTGTGLRALMLLPWNLVAHGEYFHAEGELSWSLIIGTPFAVYAIIQKGYTRRLALVGLSFALFWFYTAQIVRYLIPVLPILCVLAAIGMGSLFERFFKNHSLVSTFAAAVIAVLLVFPGWRYAVNRGISLGLPPVNAEARDRYLGKNLQSYGAIRYLERVAGASYTLYSYNDSYMAYFVAGEFRGDIFGPWRYSRLTGLLNGPEDDLARELKSMQINYLLVRDNGGGSECRQEWLTRQRVTPFFRIPGVALFAVSDTLHRAVYGPEVVRTAMTDSSASQSACVESQGDVMYYASCTGKSLAPVATVVFQLVWMEANGKRIRTDETTGTLLPRGDTLQIIATSPPGSSSALISCSALGGTPISVGSLSLRTIRFEPVASSLR